MGDSIILIIAGHYVLLKQKSRNERKEVFVKVKDIYVTNSMFN